MYIHVRGVGVYCDDFQVCVVLTNVISVTLTYRKYGSPLYKYCNITLCTLCNVRVHIMHIMYTRKCTYRVCLTVCGFHRTGSYGNCIQVTFFPLGFFSRNWECMWHVGEWGVFLYIYTCMQWVNPFHYHNAPIEKHLGKWVILGNKTIWVGERGGLFYDRSVLRNLS